MKVSSQNASVDTAPRKPQRQRGRDRVAGLLAAAAAAFVERGVDAATMTEVAARAGASIGSLYLFFPTKAVLAQTLLTDLADALSDRLDALHGRCAGWTAATMADALFDELSAFMAANPVYAVLIDQRNDDNWRQMVRARRRAQIAALFAQASPALPDGQAERLAVIVPELMRINLTLGNQAGLNRDAVVTELRTMLRHHLEWPE